MKRFYTLATVFLALALTFSSTVLSAQTRSNSTSQVSRSSTSRTSRSVTASSSRESADKPQTISRSSTSRTVSGAPARRSGESSTSRSTNSDISRNEPNSDSRSMGISRSPGYTNRSTPLTGRQALSSNPNVHFTDGDDYNFQCDPFYRRGNHYFGYRVKLLPPRYTIIQRGGRTYYYYNGVYYTNHGGDYYVSRPPFGVVFTVNHPKYEPVMFNFYGDRRTLEMDASSALAEELNLSRTFARPDISYYYEDGIFFRRSYYGNGFEVVVPPAGALVTQIPEDFEMFTWYGHELYEVDNTIYRPVVVNGIPMMEVIGQLY